MLIALPLTLMPLLDALIAKKMTPVIVGGYIRDTLLHIYSKDIDIEVYGTNDIETLKTVLNTFGTVHEVGRSFGVLKMRIDELSLDISLPRTESKIAPGHKGFRVNTAQQLDFSAAARRRDFTINAIGYNTVTDTLLDPYGGQDDLKNGLLREVDANTFVEDPLRLYRAMQFAARFNLHISDSLHRLCRTIVASGELQTLPKERIFEEFRKLLLNADKPSEGIRLLKAFGALRYFDELDAMASQTCRSQKNLFDHTLLTLDTMASMRRGDATKDLIAMLSILCHKMPHEGKTFLHRLTQHPALIDAVSTLVRYNRYPQRMYDAQSGSAEILKLSVSVCIADLLPVAEAIARKCHRHTDHYRFEAGIWLAEKAQALHVFYHPPKPLLQGRDLIAQGLQPSKSFKTLLNDAYNAQLRQEFTCKSEAIAWLQTYMKR